MTAKLHERDNTLQLTRQQIIDADDRPRKEVEVPEWGGSVTIQTMTSADQDRMVTKWQPKNGQTPIEGVRPTIVQKSLVDDDGNLRFTPEQMEDLAAKSARVINRLADLAMEFNALTQEQIDEAAGN